MAWSIADRRRPIGMKARPDFNSAMEMTVVASGSDATDANHRRTVGDGTGFMNSEMTFVSKTIMAPAFG